MTSRDWREQLDRRIDRCPCGQWRFDQQCSKCDQEQRRAA